MGSLQSSLDKTFGWLLKKEAFIKGSRRLVKLCQEPEAALPERLRLSQVSQCPGSGWRPEGAGRVPAGRAPFWPGDPCRLQEPKWLRRMARAARDALPAASRSRGASPHRVFRGQLCTSAILKSSDIFHGDREVERRGGNRQVSAPCLCRSTRRREEAGGWRGGSYYTDSHR